MPAGILSITRRHCSPSNAATKPLRPVASPRQIRTQSPRRRTTKFRSGKEAASRLHNKVNLQAKCLGAHLRRRHLAEVPMNSCLAKSSPAERPPEQGQDHAADERDDNGTDATN